MNKLFKNKTSIIGFILFCLVLMCMLFIPFAIIKHVYFILVFVGILSGLLIAIGKVENDK